MVITPDSTITLYSGVDIGTDMQLAFSSATKQAAYFATKVKKAYVNCTVVKDKIGVVRVAIKPVGQAGTGEITGHDLASCNYMSFINPSFDNKTIYCYIVDYKYLNNETAEIYYMIDYWQTWLFDVSFNDMYIDREHLSTTDWAKIEANPYDKTVPQMITAEPLPVEKGYEKPFYEVQWWHDTTTGASDDGLDGRALMHTLSDMNAQKAYDMIQGDWSYWNVMLIQAPTDWSKFNYFEEYNPGEIVQYTDSNFYKCKNKTYNSSWVSGDWDILNLKTYSPGATSVSVNAGQYILDKDDYLYRNDSGISANFNPQLGAANIGAGFRQVVYSQFAGTIEQEYLDILERGNIIVSSAGAQTLPDGRYPYSCKPKGCDVLFISDSSAWLELATFYTKYNAVSQIVGIFGVPAGAVDFGHAPSGTGLRGLGMATCSSTASRDRTSLTSSGKQETVRNKKLLTSPFSYYRVVSPDGVKEYAYENFVDLANGGSINQIMQFKIILDTSGDSPKMYLIPKSYKQNNTIPTSIQTGVNNISADVGSAFGGATQYNLDEAICIGGFPEISFNTDGYLTFLASEYTGIRASLTTDRGIELDMQRVNTNPYLNMAQSAISTLGGGLSSIAGATSKGSDGTVKYNAGNALGGALSSFGSSFASGGQQHWKTEVYENEAAKVQESLRYVNGNLLSTDDPYVQRYCLVKPAYANSNYVDGTSGVMKYLRAMGLFDFVGIHVQLRKEILEYFDSWFDLYGYASGRCGIPYVIQWCRSSTGDTYASTHVDPHWVASGGTMEGTTYVKTLDCKVEHAMMPVANAIKQMFDRGIRFKKGDLS